MLELNKTKNKKNKCQNKLQKKMLKICQKRQKYQQRYRNNATNLLFKCRKHTTNMQNYAVICKKKYAKII